MNGYQELISSATNVTDITDLNEIEEMMRTEYHTLNHLSKGQFNRCARESWAAVKFMRTPEGQEYIKKIEAEMLGEG